MYTDLYVLTALSNLHVGKGDANYGIVDNEVQRDPIQGVPVIYASSLKGALREIHRKNFEGDRDKSQRIEIFGSHVRETNNLSPGKYTFHEARLLSFPVRARTFPFYHATTLERLKEFQSDVQLLLPGQDSMIKALEKCKELKVGAGTPQGTSGGEVDEYVADQIEAEGMNALNELSSNNILPFPAILFAHSDFKDILERLPVIARNQLEGGLSQNLFYEEVVPRQSRFYFFVERPDEDDHLHGYLENLGFRVQIGANASIGYGVCTLERIATSQQVPA